MALLTLGLGIAGITTIFSVINGVILRPLPYQYADRIVLIATIRDALVGSHPYIPPPKGADWLDRGETRSLIEESTTLFPWWFLIR
jgi:hypothetical protein